MTNQHTILFSFLLLSACGGSFQGSDTGAAKGGADGADGADGGGGDGADGGGGDGGSDGGASEDTADPDSGDPGGPYTGGWPQDSCADSIHATGTDLGEVVEDFALPDQYGDTVRLYDFCDHFVLLAFGAAWDGATAAKTAELRDWADWYESSGPLVVVQVLGEDVDSDTPSQADLLDWAEEYDLPFPVLADHNFEAFTQYGTTSIPTYVLLNRGMEMQRVASDLDQMDIINWLDG